MKIGVTSDLQGRLATLQTGSPYALSLVYSTRVQGDAYAVEAETHAMLARHRVSGEWFAVPADVAVAAINGAAFRLGSSDEVAQGQGAWSGWRKRAFALTVILALVVYFTYKFGGLGFGLSFAGLMAFLVVALTLRAMRSGL